MSTTAARLAARAVLNARRVIAIELLTATQGLDWRLRNDTPGDTPGTTLGAGTQPALRWTRAILATLPTPTTPSESIRAIENGLASGDLLRVVQTEIGPLRGVIDE